MARGDRSATRALEAGLGALGAASVSTGDISIPSARIALDSGRRGAFNICLTCNEVRVTFGIVAGWRAFPRRTTRAFRALTEPSEQLRRLLHDHISSYEELEVLLLLAHQPDSPKSSAQVAAALNISAEASALALEALFATGGLLERETHGDEFFYRYAPGDDESRRLISELEVLYTQQRLAIIKIMSANAFERVRGAAARRLAEAFRLERPKK